MPGPWASVRRYERKHPGELLHLDVKKLARFNQPGHRVTGNRQVCTPGAGWDYVDVSIDDHSRVGIVQIHPDETGHRVTAFLEAAVAYFRHLGVRVGGVMTDNGAGYRSRTLRHVLPTPRAAPSLHAALYAPHQRKGGTLHSNRPSRMGLRPRIPNFTPARRSLDALAISLQLASTTWKPQPSTSH